MSDNFILLTKTDNDPVIIGLANISLIEKLDPKKEESGTSITLNYARNRDMWPKTVKVIESFDQIKMILGL